MAYLPCICENPNFSRVEALTDKERNYYKSAFHILFRMKDKQPFNKNILLIVGAIIVAVIVLFFVFKGTNTNDSENSILGLNQEKFARESLAEYGYEVTDLGIINNNEAFVKVKTFGEREEQVRTSMMVLAISYPDANEYRVQIIFSGRDCHYEIDGEEYRTYLEDLKTKSEEEALNSMLKIDNRIGNSQVCY